MEKTYIFLFENGLTTFVGHGTSQKEAWDNANIREDLNEDDLGMVISMNGKIPSINIQYPNLT
jgi:hypothetical protein